MKQVIVEWMQLHYKTEMLTFFAQEWILAIRVSNTQQHNIYMSGPETGEACQTSGDSNYSCSLFGFEKGTVSSL